MLAGMGLFTTQFDQQLEDARKHVVAGDTVCPACKATISLSGATLTAFNAALSIEAHACPQCGHTISRRRPSADGL
jgi:hypothetical protein